MDKYIWIKERYLAGWVTDEQLNKYVALKVITAEQAEEIRRSKNI